MPTAQPATSPSAASAPSSDDEPSVTGVNGSIARFDMSYDPASGDVLRFGPPRSQLWPGYAYLVASAVLLGVVCSAYVLGTTSSIAVWVLEGDKNRAFPAWILASIVFASGVGTVLRARMRGVIVHPEGVEMRTLIALGVPRVRKWTWAQIDRFVVDHDSGVMLELWNGDYERLPDVSAPRALAGALAAVAMRRNKPLTVLDAR